MDEERFEGESSSDDEDTVNKKTYSKLSAKKRIILSDSDDSDASTCAYDTSQPSSSSQKSSTPNKIASPNKGWVGPDFKLNLKPLGIDKRLDKWIERIKDDPIVSSSTLTVSFGVTQSGRAGINY